MNSFNEKGLTASGIELWILKTLLYAKRAALLNSFPIIAHYRPKHMVGFWKTFSGVLDAWILHNSDQNFILPVILTRCIHDIANQLLTRHSPSASLSQVDEWTAEPSTFSIRSRLLEFFQIMAAKTLKKSVLLTESDVQTFLEGEENQNTERKTESCVFSGLSNGISRGWERKSTTGIFVTSRFLAVYLKDFFCR